MKLMLMIVLLATVTSLSPMLAAAAQADAIALTNDAIIELTNAPALGLRGTVDMERRWGSDVSVIAGATVKLASALREARSSDNPRAIHLLEMAVEYGKAQLHKEARLAAQGALYRLCEASNMMGPGCDRVSKYGSAVAP